MLAVPAHTFEVSPGVDGIRRFSDPTGQPITFFVPTITAEQGVISSHDVRQYYVGAIPGGETVQTLSIAIGTLPTGWSLNVGTESLDYNGAGPVTSVSGIVLEVITL